MRRWPHATCAALICAKIFLLHTIYLIKIHLFCPTQKPAFLDLPPLLHHPDKISHKPRMGHSCPYRPTAAHAADLRRCIHTCPMPCPNQLCFFQASTSQQHALFYKLEPWCHPLKGYSKQNSCLGKQPLLRADLHGHFLIAACNNL